MSSNNPMGPYLPPYDLRNAPPVPTSHSSGSATHLPSIRDIHPSLPWSPHPPIPPPTGPQASSSNVHILQQQNYPHMDDSVSDTYYSPPSSERKRNRASYSCTECKRRKIRCDRTTPCQPCQKRGESWKCRMSDTPASNEGVVSRKDFNDLEGRYMYLDYRFSELEKVLNHLLEAVAEGHLPSASQTHAMRARIASLTPTRTGH